MKKSRKGTEEKPYRCTIAPQFAIKELQATTFFPLYISQSKNYLLLFITIESEKNNDIEEKE